MKPPISDPFGSPAPLFNDEETRVFRQSFWRAYIWGFLSSAFLAIFLWFALTSFPAGSRVLILLFLLIVMPLWDAASATIFESIEVNRFGIKGSHHLDFVEWSQIKSARYFWAGHYIGISVQGWWFKWWLPLTLRDPKGFARAVEELAPADNPLRLCMQKRSLSDH